MYLEGNRIPECETFDVAARQLTCEVALQEGINNFTITAFDAVNESVFSSVYPLSYAAQDMDGDGISDSDETDVYGTNPEMADTDNDNINDGDELAYWGPNWNDDFDGDGILNLLDPDSDNDGVIDGTEISQGTNPGFSGNVLVAFNWEYSGSLSAPAGFKAYLDGNLIPGCETSDPDARQLTCEVDIDPGPGVFTITAYESAEESAFSTEFPFTYQAQENAVPEASDLSLETDEDTAVTMCLVATDPDGDNLTYSIVNNGSKGLAAITDSSTGAFEYVPIANANGTDFFTFKVNDGNTDSNTATVSVTIALVNDFPTAASDSADTNEDTAVTISVLSNDSDLDGDALSLASVNTASNGTTAISGSSVVYTPSQDYYGSDSFTYEISDGQGGSATGSVSITINQINDLPTAAADTANTDENTPVTIAVLSNDSDPDGDTLTITSVGSPAHGTTAISGSSVVYTPLQDYYGSDSFTYQINDNQGESATGSVTVTIVNVPGENESLVTLAWEYNGALTDPAGFRVYLDGEPVPYCETDDPEAREITCLIELEEGRRVFAVTAWEGSDESVFSTEFPFEYHKPDGENNAPVADGAYLAATEDTEAGGTLIADDQDGDILVYSITTNGSKGQVTITNSSTGDYIYVPDSDATGIDSFSFKANDGNLDSNIASVTVNIATVNDAPVASASASTETGQAPLSVTFDAGASSDIDGTISNYAWNFGDGEIGNGSVVEHIFELAGTYTIDLVITDDQGDVADTSVVVAVTAAPQVNQSPTASVSASVTSGEAPLDVNFDGTLSNDPDGNIAGYAWDFGDGATGSGSVAYHTFPTFGVFNVVLTVIDNDGASAQTTVVISATPPTQTNELPSADISDGAFEGPGPFLVSFNGSGSNDPDGQITVYSWDFGDGNTGSGVLAQHTFTEPGVYTTTLTVTDNQGGTSMASVTVTVTTGIQQAILPLETGEVEITHEWTEVLFTKTFVNPVVVAKPPSFVDSDPCVVRIRNVTETGFEIRIQEWDYLDGIHESETVNYVVMELGSYELADGSYVEAGRFITESVTWSKVIDFNLSFNLKPVLVTSINTFNGENGITAHIRDISTDGFSYKHQKQEIDMTTAAHASETVSYIAWEPSSGQLGNMTYEVNRTGAEVRHYWFSIAFQEIFTTGPAFIAEIQTTNGGNTMSLRYMTKDQAQAEVRIEEETSKDAETNHAYEVVGYMVFLNDE